MKEGAGLECPPPAQAPERRSLVKATISFTRAMELRKEDRSRFVREYILPKLKEELDGHADTTAEKLSISHPDYYAAKARGNWFSGICSLLRMICDSGLLADEASCHRFLHEIHLYTQELVNNPVKDVVDVAHLDPQIRARIAEAEEKLKRVKEFLEKRFSA